MARTWEAVKTYWFFLLAPIGTGLDFLFSAYLPELDGLPTLPSTAFQFLFLTITVTVGGAMALLQVGMRKAPLDLLERTYPARTRRLFYTNLIYCLAWTLVLTLWPSPVSTLIYVAYVVGLIIFVFVTIERLNLATPYQMVRSKGGELVRLMGNRSVDSRQRVQQELQTLGNTYEDAVSSGEAAVSSAICDAMIAVLDTYIMNKTHYQFLAGSRKNDFVFEEQLLNELQELLIVCSRLEAQRAAEHVLDGLSRIYERASEFDMPMVLKLIIDAEMQVARNHSVIRPLLASSITERYRISLGARAQRECEQLVDALSGLGDLCFHSHDDVSLCAISDSLGMCTVRAYAKKENLSKRIRENAWEAFKRLAKRIGESPTLSTALPSVGSCLTELTENESATEWKPLLDLFESVLTSAVRGGSPMSSALVYQCIGALARRTRDEEHVKDVLRLGFRLGYATLECGRLELSLPIMLMIFGLIIDPERHPSESEEPSAIAVPVLWTQTSRVPLSVANKIWAVDEMTRLVGRACVTGHTIVLTTFCSLLNSLSRELDHNRDSALIKKIVESTFPILIEVVSESEQGSLVIGVLTAYSTFLEHVDNRIGTGILRAAIKQLEDRASRGVWFNHTDITVAILQTIYDLRKDNPNFQRSEMSSAIAESLYSIAIDALEYGRDEVVRVVSGRIGWLCKKAIDDKDGPFLKEYLNKAVSLFRFCSSNGADEGLLIYLATLYVILGAYAQAHQEYQKFRIDLATAAKEVPINILDRAAQFRIGISEYGEHMYLGDNPWEAYRKFRESLLRLEAPKAPKNAGRA